MNAVSQTGTVGDFHSTLNAQGSEADLVCCLIGRWKLGVGCWMFLSPHVGCCPPGRGQGWVAGTPWLRILNVPNDSDEYRK